MPHITPEKITKALAAPTPDDEQQDAGQESCPTTPPAERRTLPPGPVYVNRGAW